jgi:hypothetical protein
MTGHELITSDEIQSRIYTIRGLQVMIDSDLAVLYRTETKLLNRAVKRNSDRFPQEFMFQLSEEELVSLRSQYATSCNEKHLRYQAGTSKERQELRFQIGTSKQIGGRRYLPYAFTEQGVAMLSAVLRSEVAVRTSIQIINAFGASLKDLGKKWFAFSKMDIGAVEMLRELDLEG